MSEHPSAEDAEPSHRAPAGTLFVPVRSGPHGCRVRLFRTPMGGRTAVAFTSLRLLTATLGAEQSWIRLAESAVRALGEPLGVTALTIDPQLVARRPAPAVPAPAAPVPVQAAPVPVQAAPAAATNMPAVAPAGTREAVPVAPLDAPQSLGAGRILLVGPGPSV
jgi:hypothetical protein